MQNTNSISDREIQSVFVKSELVPFHSFIKHVNVALFSIKSSDAINFVFAHFQRMPSTTLYFLQYYLDNSFIL